MAKFLMLIFWIALETNGVIDIDPKTEEKET